MPEWNRICSSWKILSVLLAQHGPYPIRLRSSYGISLITYWDGFSSCSASIGCEHARIGDACLPQFQATAWKHYKWYFYRRIIVCRVL